jgi:predicted permease
MNPFRRFHSLFQKKKLESDMDEEMRLHLELQAESNRRAGLNPDEARYTALRQFGNMAGVQQQVREQRSFVWLEQLVRDGATGVRTMRKNPGFALLATLTLALGLGLNLAIVALGNAVLFRPLPGVRSAGELVVVSRQMLSGAGTGLSYPGFIECRASVTALRDLAAYCEAPFSLAADQRTERVMGEYVSGNYFETLGVKMAAGRSFLPGEDEFPGRNPVAVISDHLWQQRWQRDPGVVGREVMIDGHPLTIVGVAEAGFRAAQLPTAHDLWVPLHLRALLQGTSRDPFTDRESFWLRRIIGRLAPHESLQQARDQFSAIASRSSPVADTARTHPWTYRVAAYGPFPGTDLSAPRIFLGLLEAIALLVLAVVSANVASLFLSRALGRRREVAVRLALGASRGRVVRQFLAEGLAVATVAGAIGLLGANLAADWLVRQLPGENGEVAALDLTPDLSFALAGVGLVLASTLAVGLLPAWQGSRVDLLTALKAGERGQSGARSRLRSLLVVAQIALSVVLLVGAGLMYRSQRAFDSAGGSSQVEPVLLARLDPVLNGYDVVRGQALYSALLDRVRLLPDVQSASLATVPAFFDGSMSLGDVMSAPGETAPRQPADANVVSRDYFSSLGLSILRGRDFERTDGPSAPAVVIINRTLSLSLWPAGDAVGKTLYFAEGNEPPRLVIGVASDDPLLRSPQTADEPRAVCYVPLTQRPLAAASLHVRTAHDPAMLLPLVQAALRELDPAVPLFQITTLESARERSLWQQRVIGRMVLGSGAAAVLLALMGLYAAVAQDVARRSREIGIRVAVGADPAAVLSLVLRQGMKLAAFGLVLGFAGALAVTQLFRSVLIGVTPTDPLTFTLVMLGLTGFAAIACWLPARRATRVDPIEALRAE